MKKIIDMLKSMTNSKKKVFALALSVCVIVLSIASSSIAYFTDTAEYSNVFTSGKVDIQLRVNTSVANDTPLTLESDNAFPGKKIDKVTTIENIGTEDAYVGAIVTLTYAPENEAKAAELINITGNNNETPLLEVTINSLFGGLVSTGYRVEAQEITNGYAIYIVKEDALAKKDGSTVASAKLFDNIVIPEDWDNAEMEALGYWTLSVKAYAVQTSGLDGDGKGAVYALKEAFDAFDSLS